MAGIDNTILAEILLALSPYSYKSAVWDMLTALVATGEEGAQALLSNPDPRAIRELNGKVSESKYEQNRFFTGLHRSKKNTPPAAWWPNTFLCYEGTRFDQLLSVQLTWYIGHNYRSAEEAWGYIEKVCRTWRVPRRDIDSLHAQGGPEAWVEEMIRRAKFEQSQHHPTQKFLASQAAQQEAARPGRPYRLPDGTEDDPPYGAPDQPVSLLEGKRLTVPHPAFRPWQAPENWGLVGPLSGSLEFDDGSFRDIPYLELYGDARPGAAEFVEGDNLFCHLVDTNAALPGQVTALSYAEAFEEERQKAKALGYTHHPPKLWLDHLDYLEGADDPLRGTLDLYLGASDYLGQRVYRRELAVNPQAQAALQTTLSGLRGNAETRLRQCPWASCGGGVWPVVRDGNGERYVIVSFRNPHKVAEVAERLSYGSSGSYDRSTGSPARAMAREIQEELGLPAPEPEALTLISLGVDTERYLIQFSYLWDTPYTMAEVGRYRRNRACTAGEQVIFFVPLHPQPCGAFLRQAAFEPGAAYSLMRLLQKTYPDRSVPD